jgi:hypothetical protein
LSKQDTETIETYTFGDVDGWKNNWDGDFNGSGSGVHDLIETRINLLETDPDTEKASLQNEALDDAQATLIKMLRRAARAGGKPVSESIHFNDVRSLLTEAGIFSRGNPEARSLSPEQEAVVNERVTACMEAVAVLVENMPGVASLSNAKWATDPTKMRNYVAKQVRKEANGADDDDDTTDSA